MSALKVSISEDMREFIEAQVAEGRYDSADAYVGELIRADQVRKARAKIDALLLEALQSPATEMTKADWDDLRRRVRERHGSQDES